jgi:hypothetical protein
MNGFVSKDFSRETISQRKNYKSALEKYFLFYHDEEGIEWTICDKDMYWTEEGVAVIS